MHWFRRRKIQALKKRKTWKFVWALLTSISIYVCLGNWKSAAQELWNLGVWYVTMYHMGSFILFHFILGIYDKCPITVLLIEMWIVINMRTDYTIKYTELLDEKFSLRMPKKTRNWRRIRKRITALDTSGFCRFRTWMDGRLRCIYDYSDTSFNNQYLLLLIDV